MWGKDHLDFFFSLSVKVNTSESLRTWLLSYSINCGIQTRGFYILELTEFGSILLMHHLHIWNRISVNYIFILTR